jgi:hypothetical protein
MAEGDLADVAASGQQDVTDIGGAQQDPFENTDYSKLKFLGVQQDLLETSLKIGDEVTATVRGVIIGDSHDRMKDGHIRHTLKVDVSSVALLEDGE